MIEGIANRSREGQLARVEPKPRVADPAPEEAWTRPETYLGQLARKRTYRRSREGKGRTQPERPRLLLSTVPFLALFGLLAVLAIAIMIVAFPGNQPSPKARAAAQREQGVAQKGWFQEAQKEMHH